MEKTLVCNFFKQILYSISLKYYSGDEMKGKVWILIVICFFILVGVLNGAAMAKKPLRQAGNSNMGILYLFEKDPVTWEIIEHGAWGKMKYTLSGSEFDFVFNGHGLESGLWYSLIYYPDPWPGYGLIILSEARADDNGKIKVQGSVNTEDLPAENDENYPDGAKIWLVLSEDVGGREQCMIGWNPTKYLFENNLINFDDIDNNR